MRVAFDLKVVPPNLWAEATHLLQSVGKQAGGWKNKSHEKAPAA
jgi:hypothetical protein